MKKFLGALGLSTSLILTGCGEETDNKRVKLNENLKKEEEIIQKEMDYIKSEAERALKLSKEEFDKDPIVQETLQKYGDKINK